MTGQFESKSIANLLARNFDSIKEAYEVFDREGSYLEFACTNDEVFQHAAPAELFEALDGMPFKIGTGSETMSRLLSLQYAYLLTRYAEKAASENHLEKSLIVLAEASYYSGFVQGIGKMLNQQTNRPDSSLSASHAAKTKYENQSAHVKRRLLELLESKPREEKWSNIEVAIRPLQASLEECIQQHRLRLKYYNLPRTIETWCKKDAEFKERLSNFVKC